MDAGQHPAKDDNLPAVDIREFVDKPTYQMPTKREVRFRWNLLPDVVACFHEQARVIEENENSEPSLFQIKQDVANSDSDERREGARVDILTELLGGRP
jgi:hypothetical protein